MNKKTIFAGVGEWYIVQVEGDYVGAVSKKYVKAIYPTNNGNNQSTGNNTNNQGAGITETNFSANSDEKEVSELINQQRKNNGLHELKFDNEIR